VSSPITTFKSQCQSWHRQITKYAYFWDLCADIVKALTIPGTCALSHLVLEHYLGHHLNCPFLVKEPAKPTTMTDRIKTKPWPSQSPSCQRNENNRPQKKNTSFFAIRSRMWCNISKERGWTNLICRLGYSLRTVSDGSSGQVMKAWIGNLVMPGNLIPCLSFYKLHFINHIYKNILAHFTLTNERLITFAVCCTITLTLNLPFLWKESVQLGKLP